MNYQLEIRCSKQSRKKWDALYKGVPEHQKLPGHGIPEWHYLWNFCLDCSSSLMFCRNNPYGFDTEYDKERRKRYADPIPNPVQKPLSREERKLLRMEEDARLAPLIKESYLDDEPIWSIANKLGISTVRVRDSLKNSGIKIVRSRQLPLLIV